MSPPSYNGELNREEVRSSLRALTREGIFYYLMFSLTSGAFLVDYALTLGANNFHIGILGALPFLANLFQLPAIALVEKLRRRKLITVIFSVLNRLSILSLALIPLLHGFSPLVLLFILVFLAGFFMAFAACSWNSWVRDLVPEAIRGRYFSRRLQYSMFAGMALSLLAAYVLERMIAYRPGAELWWFSLLFAIAALLGMVGTYNLSRMRDVAMAPASPDWGWKSMLRKARRDVNFRQLLRFSFLWQLALNFSAPFFAVYMLRKLHYPLEVVVLLTVFNQLVNVFFLRVWGILCDRFGYKPSLLLAGGFYLFSFALWPFTSLPERHAFTFPLLIVIHFLMGMSSSGVALITGVIAHKFSPRASSASYIALNSVTASLAAGIAPLLGGLVAHWLSPLRLFLNLSWQGEGTSFNLTPLYFTEFDFVFYLSITVGIVALTQLRRLREPGEKGLWEVYLQFLVESRRAVRGISTATGLSTLVNIPIQRRRER